LARRAGRVEKSLAPVVLFYECTRIPPPPLRGPPPHRGGICEMLIKIKTPTIVGVFCGLFQRAIPLLWRGGPAGWGGLLWKIFFR